MPRSLLSLDWLHTPRSGLRQPRLQLGKCGGRSRPHGVLHFCGGRGRSLWVAVRVHWRETRPRGRRRRGPTGLPGKSGSSGSSGSSEETDGDWSLPLKLLLKARFGSGGWNHGTAGRRGCRCDLRTPLAAYVRKSRVPGCGRDAAMAGARRSVQTETPRDFRERARRPLGPSAGSPAAQHARPPRSRQGAGCLPSADLERSGRLRKGSRFRPTRSARRVKSALVEAILFR